jgi:amino acid adenylation domain-containing protein
MAHSHGRLPAEPARCVHHMIEEQAASRPEAPAVCAGNVTLSYRALDAGADHVARRLLDAGAGRGQIVGVIADRSPQLITALLAVLKCGAAYLALENDVPAEHRARLLRDAGVGVVLADGAVTDLAPQMRVLPLDDAGQELPAARQAVHVCPGDLAYVSYTSGSTGKPKGVAVPHTAVWRLVRDPDWARFSKRDTFLQLAPVAFDASTLEIWAPLTAGARLVIYPPGRVDAAGLADVLAHERVSVLWLTAGLFHQMAATQLASLGRLRHLIAGGDVVSAKMVRALLARHPHLTFTNGYGPTENTTFTTCWTSRTPPAEDTVPIGRPIRGTRVAILDGALRPVPAGAVGELYAGGTGLARCYLGQPTATAERFVPDPLSSSPGARMYRTGDLARWRPDGAIDFLGRADRQVKVRGYRVELTGVERLLEQSAEVSSALVVVEHDDTGVSRLAGLVTPSDPRADPGRLAGTLRRWLLSRVPPYLVPARLVVVHQLPLTRNGKVDRSAFGGASRAPRPVDSQYVAPRDPLESFLAELWAESLMVEPVGIHDDFFELGGHSLIAGELLSRLHQEFGIELPARAFYLQPTVAELAEALNGRLPGRRAAAKGARA